MKKETVITAIQKEAYEALTDYAILKVRGEACVNPAETLYRLSNILYLLDKSEGARLEALARIV